MNSQQTRPSFLKGISLSFDIVRKIGRSAVKAV
jgi:hypothetical protein